MPKGELKLFRSTLSLGEALEMMSGEEQDHLEAADKKTLKTELLETITEAQVTVSQYLLQEEPRTFTIGFPGVMELLRRWDKQKTDKGSAARDNNGLRVSLAGSQSNDKVIQMLLKTMDNTKAKAIRCLAESDWRTMAVGYDEMMRIVMALESKAEPPAPKDRVPLFQRKAAKK